MANEVFDGADVIGQLLGKRERLPDQTRDPLSQCAVKPLDVVGDAHLLVDDSMLLFWNHTLIRLPAICIEPRMLPVELGYGFPQRFGTYPTAV